MNAPVHIKKFGMMLSSKMIDWLDKNPQKVATASQWLGILNNLQSVRMEEKERSGIIDYLSMHHSPSERIQVEKLMEYIDYELWQCQPIIRSHWKSAFRPSLDVKAMAEQLPKRVEAKAKKFVEKAQACHQHPSIGYWIIRTGYEDLATIAPNWIVLDHKGKMLRSHERHGGWFPTVIEAFDEMHRAIRKRFDKFGSEHPNTLYDQYALMGGKNYQEWFICLPDWPLAYSDRHFKLQQLLVHIRTTERIDHDGHPLLMVEEIQSPWHADIHKHGSSTDEDEIGQDSLVADAPFAKEWHELAIKAVIWLAIKQGFTHIGFTTGKQQCERWGKMEGLMNLYDQQIPKCLQKIASQYGCDKGLATIVTRKPTGKIRYIHPGEWEVQDANKEAISPSIKNKDVALFLLSHRSTLVKEQIRVLQISHTLRRAMEAFEIPLFGW